MTDYYLAYREWLGEAIKATGCQLHAYVQMTKTIWIGLQRVMDFAIGVKFLREVEAENCVYMR